MFDYCWYVNVSLPASTEELRYVPVYNINKKTYISAALKYISAAPPPPPPPPAIQTFHTGMQLPEKYKENFDVSSEGLCQEVSRHQVVLVLCQTGKFGNCMSEITKIWTPKFLGKREIIFNYFRKYINCIWNEIASLLLYIWHFGQFDGVPGWMKMS
jgi:hypothetical protein